MAKTELKTAPLSIRIRPSLKASVERLAQKNRRSVAEYVEIVLEDHVAEVDGIEVRAKSANRK